MDSNNKYFEGDIEVCGDIQRDSIETEYGRMANILSETILEHFIQQPGFQMTKANCHHFAHNLKKRFVYDNLSIATIEIERKPEIGQTAINVIREKDCPKELWQKIIENLKEEK